MCQKSAKKVPKISQKMLPVKKKIFFLFLFTFLMIYVTLLAGNAIVEKHLLDLRLNSTIKTELDLETLDKYISNLENRVSLEKMMDPTPPEIDTSTISTTTIESASIPTTKKPSIFQCYKNRMNRPTLPNILHQNVTKDKSIFFLETSCRFAEDGRIKLTIRQACSIESAALANPGTNVHLLIAVPSIIKDRGELIDKVQEALLTYKNFQMNFVDIDEYFWGTPVEHLYKSGQMEYSYVPMVHISDVLRFITMWRYGAIYLDLDVLVMKSVEDLAPNFTGLENVDDFAAGVMRFVTWGLGNKWINEILADINSDFRPDLWNYNANGALRRFAEKLCNVTTASEMTPERCQGFVIYPHQKFYSVIWQTWQKLFDTAQAQETLEQLKNSNSTVTHMWNYLSTNETVTVGGGSAYDLLAKQYCPKVYSVLPVGSTF